jgi:hypothetical protein
VWISIHTRKPRRTVLRQPGRRELLSRGTSSTPRRSVDFNPHKKAAKHSPPAQCNASCLRVKQVPHHAVVWISIHTRKPRKRTHRRRRDASCLRMEQVPRHAVVWIPIHTHKPRRTARRPQCNARCFRVKQVLHHDRSVDFNPHTKAAKNTSPATGRRDVFPRGTSSTLRGKSSITHSPTTTSTIPKKLYKIVTTGIAMFTISALIITAYCLSVPFQENCDHV